MHAAVPAQNPADGIVRIEIAIGEAATVVVDEQRVRAARLERGVVPRGERDGAANLEVADWTNRSWPAGEDGSQAAATVPRFCGRERLRARFPALLEQLIEIRKCLKKT